MSSEHTIDALLQQCLTMPWCDLFQTDGAPPIVERVLRELNTRVQAALVQIGHPTGFTFGRILGTPVENLYAALKVELSYSDAWLRGRPRLEQLLRIP